MRNNKKEDSMWCTYIKYLSNKIPRKLVQLNLVK